ncbi:MAG: zinc-dependent metalloprotease [Gemmatimonadota bacterium]
MKRSRTLPCALVFTFLLALPACSLRGGPDEPVPPSDRQARGGGGDDEAGPRPYADVVPESAETDSGLFVVHRTDEELLFEVPDSLLGREMLVISRIARVPTGVSGFIVAGHKVREQVWTWERRGDRVLLRRQSYEQIAPDSTPIAISVVNNNLAPIVMSFDVEAVGPDGNSVVLDVTELFEGDVAAISGLGTGQRQAYGVRRLDGGRSFVEFARSFPENVDVRHTLSYEATDPPGSNPTNTISMEMHQSMVLLPEEPMRPRYADERVGYFGVSRVNFGRPAQKAESETFIRRWRLEPGDRFAYARGELVDPVEPIVYWIDPATPVEYRECVRRGVEDWQAAFETAGFSNAIIARDAPTPEEDPDWDMADVRYSVVRWAASMVRNAMGPSVSDPRSGEIIESDIVWYHNHMRSYRNRLMLETGAANPLARDLPIDDGLMCEAMRQVIAHEVGHALGLPHNMIASSAYPVDSLRTPDFARRMGVAPSVMEYGRQNYIAQPGDGLEGADFIRQIGPYDHHAINWGYRVIPDAETPEDELPTLREWILERADDPIYRYQPQSAATFADPRSQTEDLGDDAVRASGYGIANLRRVIGRLVEWTTDPGENYDDLEELYGELLGQWSRYVNHVVNQVGGVYVDLKTADQPGPVYDGVPRERQEEAVAFLADQVFEAPVWLNEPDVVSRIGRGGFDEVSRRQAAVLGSLLDVRRLGRIAELEVIEPEDAYPLAALLDDVRDAVWGDPVATAGDPYRRALQRAHIEELGGLMTEEPADIPFLGSTPDPSRTDLRPLVRAQLRDLRAEANRTAGASRDRVVQAHLLDVVERIGRILEPGGAAPRD